MLDKAELASLRRRISGGVDVVAKPGCVLLSLKVVKLRLTLDVGRDSFCLLRAETSDASSRFDEVAEDKGWFCLLQTATSHAPLRLEDPNPGKD